MNKICCFLFIFLALCSCSAKSTNDSIAESPVTVAEPISVTVNIQRFDKDLWSYLDNPTPENMRLINNKYKEFLPAFGRITINNSDTFKPEFFSRLRQYFSNEMLGGIYKNTLDTFSDMTSYEEELSVAEKLISENFSGKKLPLLSMHVSGFKENVMVLEGVISISGDKYLGKDYAAYRQFFDDYQRLQMEPGMITRDYLRAWLLSDDVMLIEEKKNLLTEMVQEGKVLYTLSQLLPSWADTKLIGYTADNLKWCEENESKIWKAIVSQNHLYGQDYLMIQKYMNTANYTATLSTESPGRVGAWVGWQIVKAYVAKNATPFGDLLKLDAQKVLKGSVYNP